MRGEVGSVVGDLDTSGYAKDIGAGDTARFLSTRYRIDSAEARRDAARVFPVREQSLIPDPERDPRV